MSRAIPLLLIVFSHGAAFAWGWHAAPRELLDENVKQTGFFSADTTKVLSAAVLSLRAENKLLCYSYRGDARVAVSRSELLGLVHGTQLLFVPAEVSYFLPLTKLRSEDVRFDTKAGVVTVALPSLQLGEIAFQPEAAVTVNGGLLTLLSNDQVQELTALNYTSARRAFVKGAEDRTLIRTAQEQCSRNVVSFFQTAFRTAGAKVNVVAEFRDDAH